MAQNCTVRAQSHSEHQLAELKSGATECILFTGWIIHIGVRIFIEQAYFSSCASASQVALLNIKCPPTASVALATKKKSQKKKKQQSNNDVLPLMFPIKRSFNSPQRSSTDYIMFDYVGSCLEKKQTNNSNPHAYSRTCSHILKTCREKNEQLTSKKSFQHRISQFHKETR